MVSNERADSACNIAQPLPGLTSASFCPQDKKLSPPAKLVADPSTGMCLLTPRSHTHPHTHTPPEPEVQVITECGQQHELAGEGREVVMEEEDSREQEVGEEVDQPPDHQHTPTGHPTLKLNCVCV